MRFKLLLVSGLFGVGLLLLPFSYASYTYQSNPTTAPVEVNVAHAQEATESAWSLSNIWSSVMRQVDGVVDFAAQAIEAVGDAPDQLFDVTSNDPPSSPGEAQALDPSVNANTQLPTLPVPQIYDGTLVINVPLQVSNGLSAGGQTTVNDLSVTGAFSINDLDVPGVGSFGSVVGGGSQFGSVTVTGNTQLNTLSVSGPVNFANLTASNLTVTNNLLAEAGLTTAGADIDLQGGNIFAANVINEIVAGSNIDIDFTNPGAPIIAADVPSLGSRVRRLNGLTGTLSLVGGSGITVSESGSNITIASASGLGTYLGLTDTPTTYLTGAIPFVAATGSALTQSVNLTFDGSQLAIGSTTPVTALTVDGAISLLSQQETRWYDLSDTNYVGFRASSSVSTTTIWTLPPGDGNANDIITTDGSGNLSFVDPAVFGAVSDLDDLSDVTVTGPTLGQFLQYNGAQWVNVASTSLGLGDGTYLGLSDTPGAYIANAIPFASSTAGELIFSSDLVFDGANMGIGESTPLAGLHIDRQYVDALNTSIRMSGNIPGLSFESSSGNSRNFAILNQFSGPAQLNFNYSSTFGGEPLNVAMTIDGATGNVGVGTTNPTTTFSVNGDTSVLGAQAARFYDASSTNYVGFRASSTLAGDQVWTLPAVDGNSNEFIVTDGAGNLRFADASILGGVTELNDLSDVTLATTTQGDVLVFDGSDWINQATSSLGLGDGTYLGLSDTPSSYTSDAVVFTNAAGSALSQSTNFTFDGTQVAIGGVAPVTTLTLNGDASVLGAQAVRFYETDNSNFVGFRASSTLAGDQVWTLPDSDGTSNNVLVTDGAGNLRFTSVSAVGGGVTDFLALTDTPGSYVTGAIPFTASTTDQLIFSTDLFFDGTNLGVGTNAPGSELTVHGSFYAGADGSTPGLIYDDGSQTVSIGTTDVDEKVNILGGTVWQRGGSSADNYIPGARGSLSLPANANGVTVVGATAYAVSAISGSDFHVIDVTDKDNPILLGATSLPSAGNAVDVSGQYAYVVSDVTGDDFHVIDISDPRAPAVVGSVNLTTSATAVEVRGRYAYVTTGSAGNDFHIIDIVDPTSPVEMGSVNLNGNANDVGVSGDHAFVVTDTLNELASIDISDPMAPTLVATTTLTSNGGAIAVRGDYAYVGTNPSGDDFHIFDISDPSSLTNVSSLGLTSGVNDVVIVGYYAYVTTAGTDEDLRVIDISDLSAPVEVGGVEVVSGSGLSLYVQGRYAYVGSPNSGDAFHIFDITGVEAQSVMAHSVESGALAVLGDLVAADANFSDGLRVGSKGIQTDGELLIQGASTSIFIGNIAVGTSTAPHTLTVGGDVSISGRLFDSGFNAGTFGQLLMATGTGSAWTSTSSLGLSEDFTTSADLATIISNETGSGNLVFSGSPAFTGTTEIDTLTVSSTLSMIGSTANIALGSNYLSGDGGDEGVFVTSAGFVGVATTTPASELSVEGTIMASNLYGGATSLSTDAQGNIIRTPSDERLKTNVVPVDDGLETVLALRAVRFNWIDASRFGEQTEVGFIAQEVDLILPEVVRKGGEYWSLNIQNMTAIVIGAIQEMWEVITGNQEKIETLESRVQHLESLLEVAPQTGVNEDEDEDVVHEEEDEVDTENEDDEVVTESGTSTEPIDNETSTSSEEVIEDEETLAEEAVIEVTDEESESGEVPEVGSEPEPEADESEPENTVNEPVETIADGVIEPEEPENP